MNTRRLASLLLVALLLAGSSLGIASEADHSANYPVRDTPKASIERGRIAFEHYCALCHGVTGVGNGRAARLYTPPPANLVESDKNAAYKELIIRLGGAALGRSSYMPPWEEELTEEQVADIVRFLGSIVAPPKAVSAGATTARP